MAAAILLIVLVVIGLYWYQTLNGPLLQSTYSLGDEIKGFPVKEMSMTVCNMTTSQTVLMNGVRDIGGSAGLGNHLQKFVILTLAIQNLEGYPIYFNGTSDSMSFSNATSNYPSGSYHFTLKYGSQNHKTNPYFLFQDSNGQPIVWGMDIVMPDANQVTSLSAHQTVYGYLYFLIDSSFTQYQLQCFKGLNFENVGSNAQPTFSVNLQS